MANSSSQSPTVGITWLIASVAFVLCRRKFRPNETLQTSLPRVRGGDRVEAERTTTAGGLSCAMMPDLESEDFVCLSRSIQHIADESRFVPRTKGLLLRITCSTALRRCYPHDGPSTSNSCTNVVDVVAAAAVAMRHLSRQLEGTPAKSLAFSQGGALATCVRLLSASTRALHFSPRSTELHVWMAVGRDAAAALANLASVGTSAAKLLTYHHAQKAALELVTAVVAMREQWQVQGTWPCPQSECWTTCQQVQQVPGARKCNEPHHEIYQLNTNACGEQSEAPAVSDHRFILRTAEVCQQVCRMLGNCTFGTGCFVEACKLEIADANGANVVAAVFAWAVSSLQSHHNVCLNHGVRELGMGRKLGRWAAHAVRNLCVGGTRNAGINANALKQQDPLDVDVVDRLRNEFGRAGVVDSLVAFVKLVVEISTSTTKGGPMAEQHYVTLECCVAALAFAVKGSGSNSDRVARAGGYWTVVEIVDHQLRNPTDANQCTYRGAKLLLRACTLLLSNADLASARVDPSALIQMCCTAMAEWYVESLQKA